MTPLRLDSRRDPYPVLLSRGLVSQLGPLVRRLWSRAPVVVITQRTLDRRYGRSLRESLDEAGMKAHFLFVPEGEQAKNLDIVRRLYSDLVQRGVRRDGGIVAFGGGVVGDVAGFVAATYLRGIRYAQVPTTLLAQIDSSLGGKVGVNLPEGKNLVGAIWRPSAVWIDPNLLASLPEREFSSGLFELLKYGFIGSAALFRRMERAPELFRPDSSALDQAIVAAARIKLSIVRRDEREGGLRRILNFGHTVGHGLEAAGDYRLLTHGEAVGWGMIAATRLAFRRRLVSGKLAERMEAAVRRVAPLPELARLEVRRVLEAMNRDKKIGPRGHRFVLPVALGRVQQSEGVERDTLRDVVCSLGVGLEADRSRSRRA